MKKPFGTAVVLGASIAGSCVGQVLSKHFETVYIVERDEVTTAEAVRPGTPHAHHFHGLQACGHRNFETLFPGFTEQALAAGASLLSLSWDVVKRGRLGALNPRYPSDHPMLAASRGLVESILRKGVLANPNVILLENTSATGLVEAELNVSVGGVRIAGSDGSDPRTITAELIVDATGRLSMAPKWLQELGYDAPRETSVNAHWGYTSAWVEAADDWKPDYKAVLALPQGTAVEGPKATRGGAMFVQEGTNRWILSALGSSGDAAPTDEAGFRAFLDSIEMDEFSKAVSKVKIVGPIRRWRKTVNRMRHFDELDRSPDRFVVLGDAVAAFNPVYGQGMAVAGLGAVDFQTEIAEAAASADGLTGLSRRFQKRLAQSLAFPWSISTGSDYRSPGVEGDPQPADATALNEFTDRVEALGLRDLDVHLKLLQTVHMVRTPEWLAAPEFRERIRAEWDSLGAVVDRSVGTGPQAAGGTDYGWLRHAVVDADRTRVSILAD